jgi:hypothetical protein
MSPPQVVTIPQPDPLPLPAPPWLFWALLMLTFVLHLLAMNVTVGGAIIGLVARLRARDGRHEHLCALGAGLSKALPVAIAATVTLGVAPLLLVQVLFGRLFFTGSILMAWFWLSVVPVLLVAYACAYRLSFRASPPTWAGLVFSGLISLLLLLVAFVYVNNMSLLWRPDGYAALYQASARGLHLNVADATFIPRFLHMVLGAAAVAGMGIAVVGAARRHRDDRFGRWAVHHGAAWFSGATSVNLLAGIWWLVALPRETLLVFMKQDALAGLVLAGGVVLALVLLAMMVVALQMPNSRAIVKGSAGTLLFTVIFMAVTRDGLRRAAIVSAGFLPTTWVAPQWGLILIFMALLIAAAGVIGWMVRVLLRPRPTGGATGLGP